MLNCPSDYIIDIMGACNLRCRYCAQGQNLNPQPLKQLSLESFDRLSESVLPHARRITFSNWSEPFLNRDIFGIIRHIKGYSRRIVVGTSTNANTITAEMAAEAIDAGLDWLFVSLSGTTNEVYRQYHKGGDVEKVYQSIRHIAEAKIRMRSKNPALHIGYLQFPFNTITIKELKAALEKKLNCRDLTTQVDEVVCNYGNLTGTNLSFSERVSRYGGMSAAYRPMFLKYECSKLFKQPAIRCDGTIYPCCAVTYDSENALGNLMHDSFDRIWNSERYRSFRSLFLQGTNAVCNACALYYPAYTLQFNRFLPRHLKAVLWWQRIRFKQFLYRHKILSHSTAPDGAHAA